MIFATCSPRLGTEAALGSSRSSKKIASTVVDDEPFLLDAGFAAIGLHHERNRQHGGAASSGAMSRRDFEASERYVGGMTKRSWGIALLFASLAACKGGDDAGNGDHTDGGGAGDDAVDTNREPTDAPDDTGVPAIDAPGIDTTLPSVDAAGDTSVDAGPPPKLSIRVVGNKFIDGSGATLRLRGVNHSGTEYACVQGWGLFSGPGHESVFIGMEKWKINAVRIPLNEDCWLGINGVDAAHGGKAYRDAMVNWVALAHKHGMIAVIDLHWAAPATHKAGEQQPMADADHALEFWRSAATTFKGDPAVIFDLYNEPYLNHATLSTDAWSCWLNGCTVTGGDGGLTGTWKSAGMQQMLDAIRSTGATQPVMAGGLEWSNDLTGWLTHMPKDPLGQVAASFHQYKGNLCQDASCWGTTTAAVAAKVPLVTGELGQDECAHDFTDKYMDWADSVGASYLMWSWNAWSTGASATSCGPTKFTLIADWGGTATPYGAAYKARLSK